MYHVLSGYQCIPFGKLTEWPTYTRLSNYSDLIADEVTYFVQQKSPDADINAEARSRFCGTKDLNSDTRVETCLGAQKVSIVSKNCLELSE